MSKVNLKKVGVNNPILGDVQRIDENFTDVEVAINDLEDNKASKTYVEDKIGDIDFDDFATKGDTYNKSTSDSRFASKSHTHEISDVNGLETQLESKANVDDVYTKNESDTRFAPKQHTHEIIDEIKDRVETLEQREKMTRYGVRRKLGATTAELERLGDSVGLVANADTSLSSYNVVQNDFDNIFPWSHMRRCVVEENGKIIYEDYPGYSESDGDYMVEIPEFYIKHTNDGSHLEYWVSAFPGEGYEKTQKTYIAQFTTSQTGGVDQSKAGTSPSVSRNTSSFRDKAREKGEGWQMIDMKASYLIRTLYQVEFAHLNSQLMLGDGVTGASAAVASGRTLDLTSSSGTSKGAAGNQSVTYRGLEDLYGNVWEWYDGVLIDDHQAYSCDNPENYSSTLNEHYKAVSYVNHNANGYPLELGYDKNNKHVEFATRVGASSTTGYADNYYQATGLRAALFGGGWTYGSTAGLFYWNLNAAPSYASSTLGSRLLYLP